MENLRIRCRSCGKELEGHQTKTVTCGCPNMASIRGDKISAVDLSQIVMLNSYHTKTKSVLTNEDILFKKQDVKVK
jgi:ribosomal protein L37E